MVGTVIDTHSAIRTRQEDPDTGNAGRSGGGHGRYAGSSLTIQLPGGAVDNDTLIVHGAPRFAVSDRVILFIQNNGRQLVPIVGWIEGVFRLETDAATGRERVLDHDRNPVVEYAAVRWSRSRLTPRRRRL